MSEPWQEIECLFHASASLPKPERAGFLDQACRDPETRREVESLLAHAEDEDGDLARCIGDLAAALAANSEDLDGQVIGPYRIVRTLGSGGMGAVMLGIRDDGNSAEDKLSRIALSDCYELLSDAAGSGRKDA